MTPAVGFQPVVSISPKGRDFLEKNFGEPFIRALEKELKQQQPNFKTLIGKENWRFQLTGIKGEKTKQTYLHADIFSYPTSKKPLSSFTYGEPFPTPAMIAKTFVDQLYRHLQLRFAPEDTAQAQRPEDLIERMNGRFLVEEGNPYVSYSDTRTDLRSYNGFEAALEAAKSYFSP